MRKARECCLEPLGNPDVRRLRIGHMVRSLLIGGAERQVTNIVNELEFDQVILITLSASDGPLSAQLRPRVTAIRSEVRKRSFPLDVWRLTRKLKELRLDVLQTHMFWANLAGVIAGRLAGVRVIVTTEHGRNENKPIWARIAERFIISRLCDKRICVSEDIRRIRNTREKIPAEKLEFIPNGTPIREQKNLVDRSPLIIGTLGRLVSAKDYPTLIEAARMLRDKGIMYELHIVGDGPEMARLSDQVRANRLERVVHMPGFSENVDEWLSKFDIYVISSLREGQPLSLLEAMAIGLPIVATDVGGIPNTVSHSREAILVPPSNAKALAVALELVAANFSLRRRLGAAARERMIRDFSIDASLRRYLGLYKKIMQEKGSR